MQFRNGADEILNYQGHEGSLLQIFPSCTLVALVVNDLIFPSCTLVALVVNDFANCTTTLVPGSQKQFSPKTDPLDAAVTYPELYSLQHPLPPPF
jgi:hypothetical protein